MAAAPAPAPCHGSATTPRPRCQDGGGSASGGQHARKKRPGARSTVRGRCAPRSARVPDDRQGWSAACSKGARGWQGTRVKEQTSGQPIQCYGKRRSLVSQIGSSVPRKRPPPATPPIAAEQGNQVCIKPPLNATRNIYG